MELKRKGSQPSARGPAEYFTGTVRVDPLFKAPGPARTSGAYVTFEPCARSHWHTHPLGQTLIVTPGCGFVQSWAVRSRSSGRATLPHEGCVMVDWNRRTKHREVAPRDRRLRRVGNQTGIRL